MRWLALLLGSSLLAVPTGVGSAPTGAGASYQHVVAITQCHPMRSLMAGPGFTPSAGLTIAFTNLTAKVMTTIVFGLFADGKLITEVRDVGTFSPHVTIKRPFPISAGLFPLAQQNPTCQPLHATFADGTALANPFRPDWEAAYSGPRL